MCLPFKTFMPDPATRQIYEQLYAMFRSLYLGFGGVEKMTPLADILPALRSIALTGGQKS
jgi:L-ribulokinase